MKRRKQQQQDDGDESLEGDELGRRRGRSRFVRADRDEDESE